MSRFLQSFAEASLSVIERITFEKESSEIPTSPLPQLDDPLPPVKNKEASGVVPSPQVKSKETPAILLSHIKTEEPPIYTPVKGTLSKLKNVLIKALPGADDESAQERKLKKVTVVGVGSVGMAIAQTILTKAICEELALVDVVEDKVQGELLDLKHAGAFLSRVKIVGGTDYRVTEGSDVCIVTAGQRQQEGESRLSLVGRNADLLKTIVPQLVHHSPETILLMVSNPVDVLTYVAWKLSGLPAHRVIGSGTNLDSSRLRSLIAEAVDVNAKNVHGHIIGEHGDSSVPVWSGVSIAGVPLVDFLRSRGVQLGDDELKGLHQEVVKGAGDVIRLKGYTNWAVGYSVASIVQSVLRDERRVHAVSTLVQGNHGVEEEVFLSLPCLLGRAGIRGTIEQILDPEEAAMFKKSADSLLSLVKEMKL